MRRPAPPSFVPPLAPVLWPAAFDHPEWIFELKLDGFRALAVVERNHCLLVSRTGYIYRAFAPLAAAIRDAIGCGGAVLDGELVCLDDTGCPDFYALLCRRRAPVFCAFDVLSVEGRDLRDAPLIARKRMLRRLIPRDSAEALRYVEHVVGEGMALYQETCDRDLEGIVAKWRRSPYRVLDGGPVWLKIKNPAYSQARGRHEFFAQRRSR